MSKRIDITSMIAVLCLFAMTGRAADLNGIVVNEKGEPLRGVTITAHDPVENKRVSVFSGRDGRFTIDRLNAERYAVRARIIGMDDEFINDVTMDAKSAGPLEFTMKPASDLNLQRTGDNLLSLLKFDNERDKLNFKMNCAYCHQVGTLGFRTPEEPVDWEVMITRMNGFGGLYEHTKQTLVDRLIETYSDAAVERWPEFVPPPAPDGEVLKARITEWEVGIPGETNAHDLELGKDGLVYVVDMDNDSLLTLDPETGERHTYPVPGGSHTGRANRAMGPHSIEADHDGNMWVTLAIAGKMGKFDVKTKEWTIVSGAEAPAERGGYPHTLRIDQAGVVWYTDAGRGVFKLDPNNGNARKGYKLPTADQAIGTGIGESRGRTPYGIDIAPDGMVWYTKLNGNRLGRIDPTVPDGDLKEWIPPFRGPRRLHVAPDGIVWVPGFGSGVLGRFDPKTEEWKVYPLPDAMNQIPYALNINPISGEVWICGTGNDTMIRFNPETETFTHYPLPSRVTYTREIEFDEEGNVWTCNSNVPIRHAERSSGAVIKIEWR